MKPPGFPTFVNRALIVSLTVVTGAGTAVPAAGSGPADAATVRVTLSFPENDLRFSRVEGYDLATMADASVLSVEGQPVLPMKEICVALPGETAAASVSGQVLETVRLAGAYDIMPGRPPRTARERLPGPPPGPDEPVSRSRDPYPGTLVRLERLSDLAGQKLAHISVFPVQYAPADGELILHEMIEVAVTCRPADPSSGVADPAGSRSGSCAESYRSFTDRQRSTYDALLRSMVVNPDAVVVDPPAEEGVTGLPAGEYDHVIVTTAEYAEAFLPLVEWHTRKGVRDTVVTPGWIYRHYDGPGDTLEIRQFVADAASSWGTMYFLFGGEHESVPFAYRVLHEEDVPSDQYYSDFDDDWTHEVFVGRVPAGSVTQVETFVDKVLTYEKNPPVSAYPLNILLMGFDLDAATPCEILKEDIAGYLPDRFSVTRVYDSDDSNHYDDAVDALDAGQNLVNHADHCGATVMGVGSVNHGLHLSHWDVGFMQNNHRTSVVVSMGCWPNAMDQEDCIAEHFVVYNPGQAGVAYCGNTRTGIYYVGVPDGLSCQLDRDWWRGIFQQGNRRLGEIMNWAKHEFPTGWPGASYKRHCEWTFSLLGEPEMPIWLDTPGELDVFHPARISKGSETMIVLVEDGGMPVEDATVCLWKRGEVYEVERTDTSGEAVFDVTTTGHGGMSVTVTAADYLPYEGTCQVIPPHLPLPTGR